MNSKLIGAALCGVIGSTITLAPPAQADAVSDFYKGRQVSVIVPSGMGGSIGLYGQLFARHIGNHIPGKPRVIAVSHPGAGGAKAAAFVYNAAPKDGSVIAEMLSSSVLAPLLRGVKFDPTKFYWLGSIAQRASVISVWHTAPATTLDGIKSKEVVLGATGMASAAATVPLLLNKMIGTKFKIVAGYKGGGAVNAAIERGEVQGRWNFWTGWTTVKSAWLKDRKLIHISQMGPKIKALPNVPQARDLVSNPEHKRMLDLMALNELIGLGFWLAPGVPGARAAALRQAFADTMKDPKFLADAASKRAPVAPVSAAALTKIVKDGYAIPPATIAGLKVMLGIKN